MKLLTFNRNYFLLALLLFGVEVIIALFFHDRFIRPVFGDFLVVMLVYCAVKSVLNIPVLPTAIGVLLFAYGIEVFQYFHGLAWLGLEQNALARVVVGTGFSWEDIAAYTYGTMAILLLEKRKVTKQDKSKAQT